MAERIDRFDEAVARMEKATRRQRRIEGVSVAAVLVMVITFQLVNRHTVRHAQQNSDRAAAARSAELGRKLDDANARIGQLEGALAAAGLTIPEPAAPRSPTTTSVPRLSIPGSTTPGPTATTTTTSIPGRPSSPPGSQPGPPPPSSTTTTTTSRQPTTSSTTSCLGTIVLICH